MKFHLKEHNIMVDLETFGTEPNSVIVAIGACHFTPDGLNQDFFYEAVNPQSCIKQGLVVNGDTLRWWISQGEEARTELSAVPGLHIVEALNRFTQWVNKYNNPQIWGNGAAFDNVILRSAYEACDIKAPWMFWDDRCYRTIKSMFPEIQEDTREGTYHHARDDAMHQAKHLLKIYNS